MQIYKNMYGYFLCANDFFIFFFSLLLYLALLFYLFLTTKTPKSPLP